MVKICENGHSIIAHVSSALCCPSFVGFIVLLSAPAYRSQQSPVGIWISRVSARPCKMSDWWSDVLHTYVIQLHITSNHYWHWHLTAALRHVTQTSNRGEFFCNCSKFQEMNSIWVGHSRSLFGQTDPDIFTKLRQSILRIWVFPFKFL